MAEQYPPGTDVQNLVDQAMVEAMGGPGGGDEASVDRQAATAVANAPVTDVEAPVATGIELLNDVDLQVKIELGRTHMLVEDVLRLGEGSVVELDKLAGDPVDVYVNDRLVARGEVLVLNDNFCIRISEIVHRLDKNQIALAVGAGTTEDGGV